MKYLSLVLGIYLLTFGFVGCSSNEKKAKQSQEIQEVVVFDDGYETSIDGAVIIDDQDYDGKVIAIVSKQTEESIKNGKDGSQIKIMYDGFGNKTITRMFQDHPLIAGIVTRISSTGIKKAYLYTKDGLVKEVSATVADLVETATGNEIAKQTGIFALKENDVYNPMLAKAETKYSNESYEVIEADNEFEIPNPLQTTLQKIIEPTRSNKEGSVKVELQTETQIVASAENSFLKEFDEKQENKISSSLTIKKKD